MFIKKIFTPIILLILIIAICTSCGSTKNSNTKNDELQYQSAISLMESNDYEAAKEILSKITTYEDSEEKLRQCNHMILYTYILENGIAYRDVYYIEHPDTGFTLQVKENDPTIRSWYEYYIDDSTTLASVFQLTLENKDINISYYLESGTLSAEGDGVFYPKLYDGNLDNTPEETPSDVLQFRLSEESTIWLNDLEYSPYMKLNYNSRNNFVDEFAALEFYCDFEYLLRTLSEHIEYINCGVTPQDLGINIQ